MKSNSPGMNTGNSQNVDMNQNNHDNTKAFQTKMEGGTAYFGEITKNEIHIVNQSTPIEIMRLENNIAEIKNEFKTSENHQKAINMQKEKEIKEEFDKKIEKIEIEIEKSQNTLADNLSNDFLSLLKKLNEEDFPKDEDEDNYQYRIENTEKQLSRLQKDIKLWKEPNAIKENCEYTDISIKYFQDEVNTLLENYEKLWKEVLRKQEEKKSHIEKNKSLKIDECKVMFASEIEKLEDIRDNKLNEVFNGKLLIYKREVSEKIKVYPFTHPLNKEYVNELKTLQYNLNLKDEDIKEIINAILKPFYEKNRHQYEQEFRHKVKQEYPLSLENWQMLKEIQKNLYLENGDVKDIEEAIEGEAYHRNLQQYGKEFSQKIEQEGYPLSDTIQAELKLCQKSLGIKNEDVREIEKPIEEKAYQKNLHQYGKEFSQKIEQEGHPLSDTIQAELKLRQKSLGIKNEDVELVKGLIKKFGNIDTSLIFRNEQQVDYWELRNLLAAGEWHQADYWTRLTIVRLAGREKEGYLDKECIKNFPSRDLFIIDQLWFNYSKGRFGFSVQKKIFDSVKQNKATFAKQVGWNKSIGLFPNSWKVYEDLTFGLDAPGGHLPAWAIKHDILKFTNLINNILGNNSEASKHNIFGDDFVYIFSSFGEGKLDNEPVNKISQNDVSSLELENSSSFPKQTNEPYFNKQNMNMNIKNFKILMLGASGAGKTVFLASLFKELSIQKNSSFKLEVENPQQRQLLNSIYTQIITGDTWPEGTKTISEWTFNCCVQTEELENYTACQFTYFDYAGGRLTDVEEDIDFEKVVKQADAILGLLDGQKIYAWLTGNNQKLIDTFLKADLPSVLKRMQTCKVPIHFVISKWDILDQNKFSLSQVHERLLTIPEFKELLETRSNARSPVRLIPVSAVGLDFATLQPDGSMKKNPGVKPMPFLVEVPLSCVLPDRLQQLVQENLAKQKQLEVENKKRGEGKNIAVDFLFGSLDIIEELMPEIIGLIPGIKPIKIITKVATHLFKKKVQGLSEKMENAAQNRREETLKSVKNEQSALIHTIKTFKDNEKDFTDLFPVSRLV